MDRSKILGVLALCVKTCFHKVAWKVTGKSRRASALLRAIESREMGISMRDVQAVVAREGDRVRPHRGVWESKRIQRPTGLR